MKHITTQVLDIAYVETGPPDGLPVILLHGFPYDIHSYDEASQQLADAGMHCFVPFLRGYGGTKFLSADTFRSGQQAALGQDLIQFMDALHIQQAVLAGYDWGGRAACVVAMLYPERVKGLVSCGAAYNIQNTTKATSPIEPEKEQLHWYWFYLNAERGYQALTDNREQFCHHLWKTFSPTWMFDENTFKQTAASFHNPDFVDVVLHSYRFRIGGAAGDAELDKLEKQISSEPQITVPTIVLQGVDDGMDSPQSEDKFAPHFTQLLYSKTLLGIGHNLPQEAPDEFVKAVLQFQ